MHRLLLLVGSLAMAAPASAQCAEVPSELPRTAEAPGVFRVSAPDRGPPTHGTAGMTGSWSVDIENLTDEWIRVELSRLVWVDADRSVPMAHAQLFWVGPDGRRHAGRALTFPPRYRGRLVLEGRLHGPVVRYHVTQWHEATLVVRGAELSIAGCGLWFRYPRRRR